MERQNEKTRQKAGFLGVSEILKAFSGTLYGAGTRSRTRDLLITSQPPNTITPMLPAVILYAKRASEGICLAVPWV